MTNTKYWNFSTGSKIGNILMDAKSPKQAYPIIYFHGGPSKAITESTIRLLPPFSEDCYTVFA